VGRRLGADARRARLRGARDLERRLRRGARAGRTASSRATRCSRTRATSSPRPTCRSPADLENGFGESPADSRRDDPPRGRAGLVGGSIEDFTGDKARPFYDLGLAVERIAAAAEAARALPFKFTLTARCEHFLRGHADLDATIGRLQAYEQAGADVLFAPALPDLESIRAVCAALTKPLNFMAGIPGKSFSVAALAGVGVKRISLATSLYRAAMKAAREAATEVRSTGTFGYIDRL
jgi:2-methylisocitrate lyase-like PEP mutase family enzyme